MKSLNNTNFEKSLHAMKHGSTLLRVVISIVAGGVIALAGVLPVSAAPPTVKKTTHTVHHTTRRHHSTTARRSTASRTRVASAMRPKQVTIHGYADTHPYGRQATAEAPRISVTVGRTPASSTRATARRGGPPNEGHGPDTGGVIQPDGTVVAGPTSPGLPGPKVPAAATGPLVTAPIGGYGPGGTPPIIVDTPPVVTTPVPPVNGPAAPVTPPVVVP